MISLECESKSISIPYEYSIQFNWFAKDVGIQPCYIKWKVNHVQHVFILFEHAVTCKYMHKSTY